MPRTVSATRAVLSLIFKLLISTIHTLDARLKQRKPCIQTAAFTIDKFLSSSTVKPQRSYPPLVQSPVTSSAIGHFVNLSLCLCKPTTTTNKYRQQSPFSCWLGSPFVRSFCKMRHFLFVCSSNQGALPARVASFRNWTGHAAAAVANNSVGRATPMRENDILQKHF